MYEGMIMGLKIKDPKEALAEYWRLHHISRLAFFGSVLREDFSSTSDLDALVEFEPGARVSQYAPSPLNTTPAVRASNRKSHPNDQFRM
jgi:hypothetical protein